MNHMTQHTSPSGTCTLVGAGPGDPELLTLKAVKAIGQATLLLVDDLVNPEILGHASTGARIIHVGKRGGCASTERALTRLASVWLECRITPSPWRANRSEEHTSELQSH